MRNGHDEYHCFESPDAYGNITLKQDHSEYVLVFEK